MAEQTKKNFAAPLAGALCLLLLLAACAATKTSREPGVDLSSYDRLYLEPPPEDFPGLRPLIAEQLRRLGYEILEEAPAGGHASKALLVTYGFEPRRTLSDEGEVTTLLESLAVHFQDLQSGTVLAEAGYGHNWRDEPPAAMVAEVFAGLERDLGPETTGSPKPGFIKSIRWQAPVTDDGEATAGEIIDDAAAGKTSPAPERQPASSSPEPERPTDPQAAPVEPSPARLEEKTPPDAEPSGWQPRIKSWGFENWGREDTDDE